MAGRLKRKMPRQSRCSISQPPVIGPIATPIPATADQMAMAFGRSCAGKMFVRIDSVVGMIPAAPTPISARDAISADELPAIAARTEPTPNTTSPVTSARPRTKGAARAAAGGGGPAAGAAPRVTEQAPAHDPLQLARRRVELLLDRRQRDVEDRVADADDQQ